MKNNMLILALGLWFNLAIAQQTENELLTSKFDKLLAAEFKANEPGVAALVSRNGKIIYEKSFGMANLELNIPMKADHVFRIGSITKQFTAVCILQLMEQGKLKLDDEITKFIPDYPTQGNKITIENLLTHTSGIQSYTAMQDFFGRITLDLSPTEMIDHFKNEPMEFVPGTKWNYSNSGYFLLGYIIEKASGKSYPEYLEENIFKPAGMTHSLYGSDVKIIPNRASGYSEGEQGFENTHLMSMTQPYAAGSIQSTVGDLYKWHQALHAYKLVKKESLDKAFTPYILSDGKATDYGYGWSFGYVRNSKTIEHGGGINGFSTMEIYLPKEDVFVTLFSNCDGHSPEDMTARLAALAMGKGYDFTAIPLGNTKLQEYAGVYENEKGEQRIITAEVNQLYSQRGKNPKFAVNAYEIDKFFFDKALLTMDFSRNQNGEVEKLTTHGRDGEKVWIKTNHPVAQRTEIKVEEAILEKYVGEYAITPAFTFLITREMDKLFLQATGQDKFELFAEAENKFFLKVNDAQLEFVRDSTGKVTKAILNQGGRETEAGKIK